MDDVKLNEDQWPFFRQIMAWLEERDPRENLGKSWQKPKHEIPYELEEIFNDNPDDYFVLEGYAGTGKTWLIGELIIYLSSLGWRIGVGAPTNKAVGVIQDKVRQAAGNRVLAADFASVHSFVGLRMVETDEGEHKISASGESKLDLFDLFIVDEASMVDTTNQWSSIIRGRGKCLVLFVGDPAQLPPVREGDISPVFCLPQRVRMTKVTRQAEGNPLIRASMRIREYQDMEQRVTLDDMREWLPDCVKGSKNFLTTYLADLIREGVDARAVVYTNSEVLRINEDVHFMLYPEETLKFSEGETVIAQSMCVGENLMTGKQVQIMNSEELVIEHVEVMKHPNYPDVKCYMMVLKDDLSSSLQVYVPFLMTRYNHIVSEMFQDVREAKDYETKTRARKAAWAFKNAFANIRHTSALTSHKIQGSTTDEVIIHWPNLNSMQSTFEFNRALYVAVTRPRNEIKIVN